MKQWLLNWNKTDMRNILAIITLVGVMLLLTVLLFRPLPNGNNELVYMAMGYLMGQALGGVFGYYFGASKNDADKLKEPE
jgi:hypothetical protein